MIKVQRSTIEELNELHGKVHIAADAMVTMAIHIGSLLVAA